MEEGREVMFPYACCPSTFCKCYGHTHNAEVSYFILYNTLLSAVKNVIAILRMNNLAGFVKTCSSCNPLFLSVITCLIAVCRAD